MLPGIGGATLAPVPAGSGGEGGEGAGTWVVPTAGGARGMGTARVAVWPAGAAGCWYEAHAWSRVGWLRGVTNRFVSLLLFFCAVSLLGLGSRLGSPVSQGA